MKQLVYVNNKVNNSAIRRTKNERGDLIYIVPSYTLPDDCVMNGGFYPASEIAKSFHTLEDTPAPAGHPYSASGEWISANSPDGVLYFQCGIFNKNVQRVADDKYGRRVYVEKHIHVETAMKTERGKRIIDAIDAGEPIHTSTGILLEPVEDSGVNNSGKEYTWRATNMVFDHDAILLDEEGAATPDDGVGLMVNSHLFKQVNRNNQTFMVNTVTSNAAQELETNSLFRKLLEKFQDFLANHGEELNRGNPVTTTNQEGADMGLKALMQEKLGDAYNEDMTDEEVLNAYEKQLKGNAAEEPTNPKGEQGQPEGEAVLNADVQKLIQSEIAQAIANHEAAKEQAIRQDLAEKLKANGVELTEKEQGAMSVNSLQKMVEKTSPSKLAYNFGGQVPAQDENIYAVNSMPQE